MESYHTNSMYLVSLAQYNGFDIYSGTCVLSSFFLLVAKEYSIIWIYHNLFILLLIDIFSVRSVWILWKKLQHRFLNTFFCEYMFSFLEQMLRCANAGLQDRFLYDTAKPSSQVEYYFILSRVRVVFTSSPTPGIVRFEFGLFWWVWRAISH